MLGKGGIEKIDRFTFIFAGLWKSIDFFIGLNQLVRYISKSTHCNFNGFQIKIRLIYFKVIKIKYLKNVYQNRQDCGHWDKRDQPW